jgi:hypothetical protein
VEFFANKLLALPGCAGKICPLGEGRPRCMK